MKWIDKVNSKDVVTRVKKKKNSEPSPHEEEKLNGT